MIKMLLPRIVATINTLWDVNQHSRSFISWPPNTAASSCPWACLWRHNRVGKFRVVGFMGIIAKKTSLATLHCKIVIKKKLNCKGAMAWVRWNGRLCSIRRLGNCRDTRCSKRRILSSLLSSCGRLLPPTASTLLSAQLMWEAFATHNRIQAGNFRIHTTVIYSYYVSCVY